MRNSARMESPTHPTGGITVGRRNTLSCGGRVGFVLFRVIHDNKIRNRENHSHIHLQPMNTHKINVENKVRMDFREHCTRRQ